MGKSFCSTLGRQQVLGTNALGLGHFWCLEWGGFGSVSGLMLEAFRMGDDVGLKRKSLTKSMFLAYVIAAIIGFTVALRVVYDVGMFSGSYAMVNQGSTAAFVEITNHLMGSERPFAAWVSLGSVMFTGFLYYMRVRFVWWPFHPIGWVMAGSATTTGLWFSMFLVWLLKWAIHRYGGPRVIERLKPLFFAMIVGSVCMGIVEVIVDNLRLLLR
jgi:hypothetical protein